MGARRTGRRRCERAPAGGDGAGSDRCRGISRLPAVEGDRPAKKKFKTYPIGYFHIDVAEVRTEQGKLHMFVATDRTSKFAFVELHEKATTAVSRDFLLHLATVFWFIP